MQYTERGESKTNSFFSENSLKCPNIPLIKPSPTYFIGDALSGGCSTLVREAGYQPGGPGLNLRCLSNFYHGNKPFKNCLNFNAIEESVW